METCVDMNEVLVEAVRSHRCLWLQRSAQERAGLDVGFVVAEGEVARHGRGGHEKTMEKVA